MIGLSLIALLGIIVFYALYIFLMDIAPSRFKPLIPFIVLLGFIIFIFYILPK